MNEYNQYGTGGQPYGQPNNQINQPNQQPYMAKPIVKNAVPKKNSNLAVSSLVFGIMALAGFFVPLMNIIFSIVGLVSGILCLAKDHKNKTMAAIGIILSILALLLGLAVTALYFLSILYA